MKFRTSKRVASRKLRNKGTFSILHTGCDFREKHITLLKKRKPTLNIFKWFLIGNINAAVL